MESFDVVTVALAMFCFGFAFGLLLYPKIIGYK